MRRNATTARSNFSDVSAAVDPNSYDAKSAIGYDLSAAVNSYAGVNVAPHEEWETRFALSS